MRMSARLSVGLLLLQNLQTHQCLGHFTATCVRTVTSMIMVTILWIWLNLEGRQSSYQKREKNNSNYNKAYQTKLSNDFNQVMEKIQQKYSLIILDGIGKRACVCVFFYIKRLGIDMCEKSQCLYWFSYGYISVSVWYVNKLEKKNYLISLQQMLSSVSKFLFNV